MASTLLSTEPLGVISNETLGEFSTDTPGILSTELLEVTWHGILGDTWYGTPKGYLTRNSIVRNPCKQPLGTRNGVSSLYT